MNAVVSAFLLTFAGLFPIVNPLEGAPFFLGLTAGLPSAERRSLAGKAAVNGFALLLGSMVLGPWMLEVFGLQLPVVRIAGGLVVAALGWKLLTQEQWSDHSAGLQAESARKVGSFYPLTMPLTVGPGSMSVAITIGNRKVAGTPPITLLAEHAGGALLGLVVAALGWKLLTQEQWSDHALGLQAESARKVGSFYPLTMPLTVGPGSMSVAITIGSRKPGYTRLSDLAEHASGALLGLIAIALSIYLAYRFAENIARLLGETGLEVLVRLSAFILMCIGIEIVWNGYSTLTPVR